MGPISYEFTYFDDNFSNCCCFSFDVICFNTFVAHCIKAFMNCCFSLITRHIKKKKKVSLSEEENSGNFINMKRSLSLSNLGNFINMDISLSISLSVSVRIIISNELEVVMNMFIVKKVSHIFY